VSGRKLAVAATAVALGVTFTAVAESSRGTPVVDFSPSVSLAMNGAGLAVGGSVRCAQQRDFTFNVYVVEPSRNALAYGNYPAAGAPSSAFVCGTHARAWSLVVKNPENASRDLFKPGPVRICVLVHSWRTRSDATLDSSCATVSAHA